MQLLPVIDLKGKTVVRGVAGRRDEYQPIRSHLVTDPSPANVARALHHRGFKDVYVADLDAIEGREPDWDAYEQIASAGLDLMVDAGIGCSQRVRHLVRFQCQFLQLKSVVIGLESITATSELASMIEMVGDQAAVFSVDLKQGKPLVGNLEWAELHPLEIVSRVYAIGFRRLILLDLAAVGTGGGPATLDFCRVVRKRYTDVELISGGGVRGKDDVDALCSAGCDRVLVASALHDGRL